MPSLEHHGITHTRRKRLSKIPRTASQNRITYPVSKDGAYPARFVKFIGLGMQPQPDFQGKKKGPAFKASATFELAGKTVIGTKSDGTKTDPAPSFVFLDFFLFPGATRGKAFDLCKALDPSIEAVPDNLDWFISRLDQPIIVTVGHYESKTTKEIKNKVTGIGQPLEGLTVSPSTIEPMGFDPYTADETGYGKLFRFQREELSKALDASAIPLAGTEVKAAEAESVADAESNDDDEQPF